MIFALTVIQIFGSLLNDYLGSKAGAIMTGFLGGLISSTATTASLTKESSNLPIENFNKSMLIFLSTTLAMLLEALVLVWLGHQSIPYPILICFSGPIITSLVLIAVYSSKSSAVLNSPQPWTFEVWPILKLAIFIVVILMISKLLQLYFGQQGLMVLTFLVSLFEIHGSVISNVQIFESGTINLKVLTSLLTLSIVASYLSKLFLIHTLGHKNLKIKALQSTALLFIALALTCSLAMTV